MFADVEIVESRVWVHTSGRQASPYGAVPWASEADRDNWHMETRGYTWRCTSLNGDVTIGACRAPAKTYQEAERVREKLLGRA